VRGPFVAHKTGLDPALGTVRDVIVVDTTVQTHYIKVIKQGVETMSTELKGVACRTGMLSMNQFSGGRQDGLCVQLTFKEPEEERFRPNFGFWYMQLTKQQAVELAAALVEFAEGKREELI